MACTLFSPGISTGATEPSSRCFSGLTLSPKASRWLRIGALVLVLGGLAIAGVASGVTRDLSVDAIRAWMLGAGAAGVLLFVAAFALGTLVQIPGMLFVAAAALAYGTLAGAAVALVGAVISVAMSFWLVRTVGGKLLTEVDKPLMKRVLARLDRAPVRTVAVLRLVFWVAPPLNYALALSNVSGRAYLIGSAVGLIIPVTAAAVFVDALI